MSTPTTPTSKTQKVTLRKIGNSVGVTFPKDVLERVGVAEKSEMYLIETEDGLLLKRHDEHFATMMEAYHVVAEQYKNALRELAK